MPATAMIAAAVEATWEECGTAIATNLSDTKLDTLLKNRREGIGKKVAEIVKALQKTAASNLLKQAGQTTQNVKDAEVWTDVLRDRRNALHWGKCKSLVAEHADTGTLMMGAPMHIQTLEAIRLEC
jgi:hypothetical protein